MRLRVILCVMKYYESKGRVRALPETEGHGLQSAPRNVPCSTLLKRNPADLGAVFRKDVTDTAEVE